MSLAKVNIKFLAKLKNNAVETFNLLRERYGEEEEEEEDRIPLKHCRKMTSRNGWKFGRLVQSGG